MSGAQGVYQVNLNSSVAIVVQSGDMSQNCAYPHVKYGVDLVQLAKPISVEF